MLATEPTPTRSGYTFDGWYTAETGGTEVTTHTVFSGNTTVYARWVEGTVPTYTITLDANGGTVTPASGTTTAHGTLSSLPTPTRSGYTFAGWFSALTNGEAVTEHTIFYTDFTIYAHWKINTYTITFNPNGGTVNPTSATTGDDGKLASEPTPTRSGYTFDGWYTAATGGAEVTTSTVFTANTTVYAHWVSGTVPTYTITFNANSGTVTPTSGVTTAHGTLSSLPTPTRTGYDFSGWFTAATGGTAVTTSTAFTAAATIYAQWAAKTFTVTFSSQGGSAVSPQSVAPGGKAAAPTNPTRAGYTFGGWYQDVAYTILWHFDTDVVTEDLSLFAKWVFTITFNPGADGKVNPTTEKTGADGRLVFLPEPTRNGYTFDGWYTAASGGAPVTSNTVFKGDATIYAVWAFGSVNTYSITLHANGGKITIIDGETEKQVDSIVEHTTTDGALTFLPQLVRIGHVFEGWFTAKTGGEKVEVEKTKFATDATIYARWTSRSFVITFVSHAGVVDPQTIGIGGKIEKPDEPNRGSDYEFEGWFTDTEYKTEWDFENDVVTSDITLYDKWKWVGAVYTITFNGNGGTFPDGSTTVSVDTEERLMVPSVPIPTRENSPFVLAGWYSSKASADRLRPEAEVNPDLRFTYSRTLYAGWEWGSIYTITFDPNGGTVNPASGKPDIEPGRFGALPTPTYAGNIFKGWFTDRVNGDRVTGNTTFSANGAIYAHWTPDNRPTFTDTRDGKSRTYKYVELGEQIWMAENLNYDIPGTTLDACYADEPHHVTAVNDPPVDCEIYGRLYTQSYAKSACPVGWKLPSVEDWNTLATFVGADAGTKLKAAGYWPSQTGTDEYGFSALPGGVGDAQGPATDVGNRGLWWTATARIINGVSGYDVARLNDNSEEYVGDWLTGTYKLSVRCIKGE
jgi:uncharacterized protein (TIGR02145 family)/uncharacterized repeat protein (TIGR02543 family)